MNQEIIREMTKTFEKFDVSEKEVAEILRVCAKQMGTTLVVSEPKNENKMKSQFEIEEKYEELNQRMSEMTPMNIFGTTTTDAQRYILEWALGQHDSEPSLQEINLK